MYIYTEKLITANDTFAVVDSVIFSAAYRDLPLMASCVQLFFFVVAMGVIFLSLRNLIFFSRCTDGGVESVCHEAIRQQLWYIADGYIVTSSSD